MPYSVASYADVGGSPFQQYLNQQQQNYFQQQQLNNQQQYLKQQQGQQQGQQQNPAFGGQNPQLPGPGQQPQYGQQPKYNPLPTYNQNQQQQPPNQGLNLTRSIPEAKNQQPNQNQLPAWASALMAPMRQNGYQPLQQYNNQYSNPAGGTMNNFQYY